GVTGPASRRRCRPSGADGRPRVCAQGPAEPSGNNPDQLATPTPARNLAPAAFRRTARAGIWLVVFTGVFLYATGNFGGAGPASSAIGGPFRLIDQNGNPITDADIKGRPFLVFFGYTHCPDVCPTTLFDVSEVMRALGKDADRAGALFVTV